MKPSEPKALNQFVHTHKKNQQNELTPSLACTEHYIFAQLTERRDNQGISFFY